MSHTEGQGWGLLFALEADDRAAFSAIAEWTEVMLSRPGDALHSWRYRPKLSNPVDDPNNATDGDLFIAYALMVAGARWGRPSYTRRAEAIARDVLRLLVREVAGRLLLAPGVDGFAQPEGGLVVNPSYYAFTPLGALARLIEAPAWSRLQRDGLEMIELARFGPWRLPADWVLARADGTFEPAPGFPARYGYDAVRVPLYLAWARIASPVLPDVAAWWRHADPPPAWLDVMTGAVAEYPAGPGMAAATRFAIGEAATAQPLPDTADYYDSALTLLAALARRDVNAGRSAAGPR